MKYAYNKIALILFATLSLLTTSCNDDDDNVTVEATQKERTTSFFQALNTRDVSTIEELLWVDFIQHNPFVPTGRDGLIALFPNLEQFGTTANTIRMMEDGDFIVTHSVYNNATPFGADTVIGFDIFRFDSNGKIAEHWDALMPDRPVNPSGRSLTDGATTINDIDNITANKALLNEFFVNIISGDQAAIGAFVTANFESDFKQHNPDVADGINAVFEAFSAQGWVYQVNHKIIGEGNFVLAVSEGTVQGVSSAFYDLFRIENGKVAEHWDVIQTVPTTGLANNNGMFSGF